MKYLLRTAEGESIFDVDEKQLKELMAKMRAKQAALRKEGKTLDFALANLDGPEKFLAAKGVVTKSTAVTATVSDLKL